MRPRVPRRARDRITAGPLTRRSTGPARSPRCRHTPVPGLSHDSDDVAPCASAYGCRQVETRGDVTVPLPTPFGPFARGASTEPAISGTRQALRPRWSGGTARPVAAAHNGDTDHGQAAARPPGNRRSVLEVHPVTPRSLSQDLRVLGGRRAERRELDGRTAPTPSRHRRGHRIRRCLPSRSPPSTTPISRR